MEQYPPLKRVVNRAANLLIRVMFGIPYNDVDELDEDVYEVCLRILHEEAKPTSTPTPMFDIDE